MSILYNKQVKKYDIGGTIPPVKPGGKAIAQPLGKWEKEYENMKANANPAQLDMMRKAMSNYTDYQRGISKILQAVVPAMDGLGYTNEGKDVRDISPDARRLQYNAFFVDNLPHLETNAAERQNHKLLDDGLTKQARHILEAIDMDRNMPLEDKYQLLGQYSTGRVGKNYIIQPRRNRQPQIDLRKAATKHGVNPYYRSEPLKANY